MKKAIFTLMFALFGSMAIMAAQPKIWLLGDGTMEGWGKAFADKCFPLSTDRTDKAAYRTRY